MIRYTEEDLQKVKERMSGGESRRGHMVHASGVTAERKKPLPSSATVARSPFRSKLEESYSGYLHVLMLAGDIQRYAYEPITLRLAPKTTLTPDFLVITKDGQLELHETKGFAREDAMVKLKVAARLYPFWRFWLVTRFRGEWKLRELPI